MFILLSFTEARLVRLDDLKSNDALACGVFAYLCGLVGIAIYSPGGR